MTDKLYNNLRQHQKISIKKTIENNYESGVHFHATGTGKSIIALNILTEYHKKYPNRNLMWLCEQKNILHDLFNNLNVIKYINNNLKNINIINLVNKHDSNFINLLNSYINSDKYYL
jgi:superfamily II DNA or RNA helicase